jgi:L-fuculose-phosphate aldolase
MYDRFLTNSAGGNLSCRVGGHIYMTPRYAGSQFRWRLSEDVLLVFDEELNLVVGEPDRISRESRMHFACYHHFSEVQGVIHAHSRYLDVFASAGQPLPPTNMFTAQYGTIPCLPELASESQELADAVVEGFASQRDLLRKKGAGLLLARHGVVTAATTLDDAYEALESMEWAAHTRLMLGHVPDSDA